MSTRQTFEIEYEVVDLEGDLDGAPLGLARPRRIVDDEIAMLSGGLFDRLPKVEMPLDKFFPQTPEPSYWSRPRSDSLPPVAANIDDEEAPPPRRVGPGWFVGMAAAAAIGMAVGAFAPRPVMPPIVLQPATAAHALPQPAAQPAPKVVESVAPVTPAKVASGTGPVPAKAARPTPVVAPPSVPVAEPESVPVQNTPAPAAVAPQGPAQSSAAVAVAAAGRGASGCFAPDELRRTMAVSVTFAPSGRATRAVIEGGPHRATAVGSCIAQRLRSAVVAPFEGPPVTIHTSIHLR